MLPKLLYGVKKLVFLIISISLLVIAVLVAVMVIVWKKRKTMVEEKPEYKGLIALGLIFFALGIVLSVVVDLSFFGFFGVGVVYLILGFRNKEKWKNKE